MSFKFFNLSSSSEDLVGSTGLTVSFTDLAGWISFVDLVASLVDAVFVGAATLPVWERFSGANRSWTGAGVDGRENATFFPFPLSRN